MEGQKQRRLLTTLRSTRQCEVEDKACSKMKPSDLEQRAVAGNISQTWQNIQNSQRKQTHELPGEGYSAQGIGFLLLPPSGFACAFVDMTFDQGEEPQHFPRVGSGPIWTLPGDHCFNLCSSTGSLTFPCVSHSTLPLKRTFSLCQG